MEGHWGYKNSANPPFRLRFSPLPARFPWAFYFPLGGALRDLAPCLGVPGLLSFCSKTDTISDYEIKRAHFGWAERTQSTEAMKGALTCGVRQSVGHLYQGAGGRQRPRIKSFRGQNPGGKRRPPCRPFESPRATQERKRRNGEEHEEEATGPYCWSQ